MRWPFDLPEGLAVFTSRKVIKDKEPIVYVAHDLDGYWQFHCAAEVDTSEGILVSLQEIYELDKSIGKLASLQPGQYATRENPQSQWVIHSQPEQ